MNQSEYGEIMKIQEIAQAAKVSVATVSRVFGNHPNVRPEIRKKVFSVARKYDYHPRLSVKQRNIAVITPYHQVYPVQSYVEMVLSELTLELAKRDCRIEIVPQDNFVSLERISFRGAIGIGLPPEWLKGWNNRFSAPLVNIDRPVPPRENNLFSIRSDEEQGMFLGMEYLVRHGRKRIGAIIYGEKGFGNAELRRESILAAGKKLGFPLAPGCIAFCRQGEYLEAIGKMLQYGIDSLFCPGGQCAGAEAAYALSLYRKSIPREIALVSSERTAFSRYALPPQTTICQDYVQLAARTVEILFACLSNGRPPRDSLLPYCLIERDSV